MQATKRFRVVDSATSSVFLSAVPVVFSTGVMGITVEARTRNYTEYWGLRNYPTEAGETENSGKADVDELLEQWSSVGASRICRECGQRDAHCDRDAHISYAQ